ncbi:MAG: hypothetical protein HOI66_14880 [Verrucomicrobia bacterium]|nr:hypothetical protein [Verrucomicrobiota bacterium]
MKLTKALLAIVAFALLIPTTDSWAKPTGKSQTRPFKARFSTEFFNESVNSEFIFTTVVTGSGNATHLGKCSFDAKHLFAFTSPNLDQGIAWNGILELGAANGDVVNATYEGDIVPSDDPEVPFILLFTITFDGGTGRFTNATGTAEVIGLTTIEPDPSNGLFKGTSEFVFDGTIAY